MRRNAVGQGQKLLQPGLLGDAKLGDGDPAIGPTQHRTEHDRNDMQQLMVGGAIHARVVEVGTRSV